MSTPVPRPSKVNVLPEALGSLAHGVPACAPDTLFVRGINGMSVAPDADFPLVFGRSEANVHVCVGADDPHVSRRQGVFTRRHSRWVLANIGRLPMQLPDARLVLKDDSVLLEPGYTPIFILGPRKRHLLQVRIAAASAPPPRGDTDDDDTTSERRKRELDAVEKLVLVCLGQRYLRGEPHPQPVTWKQVAAELGELRPDENWTWRRAAHIVGDVRKRLSAHVPGLQEKDVAPPIGNTLNHNLIMDLLTSTTITKKDLDDLLDG